MVFGNLGGVFHLFKLAYLTHMAPKRQRGVGSRSRASNQFDTSQFIGKVVSDHYHNILAAKTLILERGLRLDETLMDSHEISTMIAQRGSKEFTAQPQPTAISIVKEFYVNAKETEGRVVQVRVRPVLYDA